MAMTHVQLVKELNDLVIRGEKRREKTAAVMYFAIKYADELAFLSRNDIKQIINDSVLSSRSNKPDGWLSIMAEAKSLSGYVSVTKNF